jgi:NAD(P)-dependent dehydrogenase (short-subunit alcohol dehydrogenase family)
MITLTGKVAVVFAGGTGIGAATSQLFAKMGAQVVITARSQIGEAEIVGNAIVANGGVARVVQCDVADRDSVQRLFADVHESEGSVDIVVNSAGLFHQTPAFDADPAKIDALVGVNLLGGMNVIFAALQAMRGRGGAIVSVTSTQAVLAEPASPVYAATKRALEHFTASLAPELKDSRIRVNCIAAGATRTPMIAPILEPEMRGYLEALERNGRSPWGEFFLEPEDIAQCILFLVSDAARGVQCTSLVADQGHTSALPSLPA